MIGEDRGESGAVACSGVGVERERGAVGVSDSFMPRARIDKTRWSGSNEACDSKRSSGAAAAHQQALLEAKQRRGRPKWLEVGVDRRTRTRSGERLTIRTHSNFNI
jgi:hypothetical protein